jgi:uncharacterized membrane protein YciS (DUF1049 family)
MEMIYTLIGCFIGIGLAIFYFWLRNYLYLRKLKRQVSRVEKELKTVEDQAMQRLKDLQNRYR